MRKLISTISTFVLLFFVFFYPGFVLARMANPDLFPKNEPLRPPAENVVPNYSNSINAIARPEAVQEEKPENSDKPEMVGDSTKLADSKTPTEEKKSAWLKRSQSWIFIVGGAMIVLGFGYLAIRLKRSGKKDETV